MRDSVSILQISPIAGAVDRTWVRVPPRAQPTVLSVVKEDEQLAEGEHRDRLIYWIRKGMERQSLKSQADFARAIGAPQSTVSRWLSPTEQAVPGITWLGAICRTLRLDPMLFARLPAIPDDPLETFALSEESDLLTVTDAARLAQLDSAPAAEGDPPAATEPSEPPRTRRRPSARQCPRG